MRQLGERCLETTSLDLPSDIGKKDLNYRFLPSVYLSFLICGEDPRVRRAETCGGISFAGFKTAIHNSFVNINVILRSIEKMRAFNVLTAVFAIAPAICSVESNQSTLSSHQILPDNFKPPQVFKNTNLVRNVNLEKGYVRETVNVVIENTDSQPQDEYFIPFKAEVIGKVGGVEARDKKDAEKPAFRCEVVEYDPYRYDPTVWNLYAECSTYAAGQFHPILSHHSFTTIGALGPADAYRILPHPLCTYSPSCNDRAAGQSISLLQVLHLHALGLPYSETEDEAQVSIR